MNTRKTITAINASSAASVTSNNIYVGDAKRIGILLRRTNHTSGSGAFTVTASMEAADTVTPTMTAINMIVDNVTNTNAQNFTRINGKTLSSNTDALLWLDTNCIVNFLSIAVTRTTDGTHSAFILIES